MDAKVVTKGRLLSGARVLVVEDEAIIAFDLAEQLQAAGATVIGPASTVATAKKFIERERLTCAVIDVRLGGELAWTVADSLKAHGVPFAFHTGQNDLDELRLRWPCAKVLMKPIPPSAFVAAVAELAVASAKGF